MVVFGAPMLNANGSSDAPTAEDGSTADLKLLTAAQAAAMLAVDPNLSDPSGPVYPGQEVQAIYRRAATRVGDSGACRSALPHHLGQRQAGRGGMIAPAR